MNDKIENKLLSVILFDRDGGNEHFVFQTDDKEELKSRLIKLGSECDMGGFEACMSLELNIETIAFEFDENVDRWKLWSRGD